LTWNAKFPTPQNHTLKTNNYYYTWNNHVGNLVNRTLKKYPKFKLDHGEMAVGLCLKKGTDERCICIQFFLTTGKKGRVKFNVSLSLNRMVLWQTVTITEELEVINNDRLGWTGGHINYVLPSDIPNLLPNLLVTVEVIEWEPTSNNEPKKNFESEKKNSGPNNDSRAGPSREIAPRIYPDFDANFDETSSYLT
jgi:hypothetical protein